MTEPQTPVTQESVDAEIARRKAEERRLKQRALEARTITFIEGTIEICEICKGTAECTACKGEGTIDCDDCVTCENPHEIDCKQCDGDGDCPTCELNSGDVVWVVMRSIDRADPEAPRIACRDEVHAKRVIEILNTWDEDALLKLFTKPKIKRCQFFRECHERTTDGSGVCATCRLLRTK
jgi:hypothetical protein